MPNSSFGGPAGSLNATMLLKKRLEQGRRVRRTSVFGLSIPMLTRNDPRRADDMTSLSIIRSADLLRLNGNGAKDACRTLNGQVDNPRTTGRNRKHELRTLITRSENPSAASKLWWRRYVFFSTHKKPTREKLRCGY